MNSGIYGPQQNSLLGGVLNANGVSAPVAVQALVVAGGGSGGCGVNTGGLPGGGGAGGFYEASLVVRLNVTITVQIGAGGAAVAAVATGNIGNYTQFGDIVITGGGGGMINASQAFQFRNLGASNGGRASGAASLPVLFAGLFGSQGGLGTSVGGGGGGGASSVGADATVSGGGNGGSGKTSTITGQALTLCGGGGGASTGATTVGAGQAGGGSGSNVQSVPAGSAAANSGSGGGGIIANGVSGAGGSGLVVLRFSNSLRVTLSAGLTHSSRYVGSDRILTITAGLGTITFN